MQPGYRRLMAQREARLAREDTEEFMRLLMVALDTPEVQSRVRQLVTPKTAGTPVRGGGRGRR